MYENFNAPSTESLDSIFNMLQKIRNKADLDTMSIDDLYNNFKIVEQEVKRTVTTSSSLGSQNMAFLSSPGSTNEVDIATIQVSTVGTPVSTVSSHDNTANLSDATVYAFLPNQPNGSQLVHEDLEQIHEDDLEEMDLKWQLALLSMRARRYFQRTNKKITINGSDTVGQGIKTTQEGLNVEDTSSKAMVAIDGAGFDWSYMADDEVPTNMALMPFSDSESLDKLIGSQISDNSRQGVGFASYNVAAPPPTGLFVPPTIDLSNSGLEEFQHPEFKGCGPKDSKSVCVDTLNEIKKAPDALIIKDWVSDSDEDEPEVMVIKSDNVQHKPEQANQPRKSGIVPISTARQSSLRAAAPVSAARLINTAAPKPLVNVAKPRQNALQKTHSLSRIPFYQQTALKNKNLNNKVNTAKGDPQDALKDQRYFDSGCSRHMTGNISYLTDFKEHDGGVLVVKPHFKTPYKLFKGRSSALSFMRPFGCHVTILNTLDQLGKFDGKSDEGIFVGYSTISKAFRVYNTRTRKVKENLHITFLENKLIVSLKILSRTRKFVH
nr:retrovirus-related Pol polyprotein from transposon TNT 1-94 [Tanacetum cinerariifolium]